MQYSSQNVSSIIIGMTEVFLDLCILLNNLVLFIVFMKDILYLNVYLIEWLKSLSLFLFLCYSMSLCILGSPGLPQQWSSHVYGGFLWMSPGWSDSSAYRGTSYQKGNIAKFKKNVACVTWQSLGSWIHWLDHDIRNICFLKY